MGRPISKNSKITRRYPVAAATTIADRDNIMIVAGFARPCADVAGSIAVGQARGAVDNSTGIAGEKYVLVEEGTFRLAGAGFADTDRGTTAYATGATGAAPTQTGTNFPALGPIADVLSATEVDVEEGLVAGLLPAV